MAASTPIPFTVDQEALLVADTNVARERPAKERPPTGRITQSPGPQPMYASPGPRPMYAKRSNGTSAPSGVPTPTTTSPRRPSRKKFVASTVVTTPVFKADMDEGASPTSLATEPTAVPSKVKLPEPALESKKQEGGNKEESNERESDIYAEAGGQWRLSGYNCHEATADDSTGSIENREECTRRSG